MSMQVLLLCLFIGTIHSFLQPFRIEHREIRSKIQPSKDPLFKQIKGFYGIIGPDINISSVTSLYELFTGDGVIQGVFFNDDKITFIKKFVRTEKLLYEATHGKFSKHIFMTPLYVLLNKIGCIPNTLGLANTAFLKTNNQIFALFERDHPYQLHIDVENQLLFTMKKRIIPGITHFSGHSKYDNVKIHSIDYDVLKNHLTYVQLTPNVFNLFFKTVIKTHYVPLIHDFFVSDNKILFLDSPFVWKFSIEMKGPPISFDHSKPTYLFLYDTIQQTTRQWKTNKPFYIFHYGQVEVGENIDIYAPVYDDIDFSSIQINGKYRHISLRHSGEIVIKKNRVLERLNLDFPLKWGRYIILREVNNNTIMGFVVCKDLSIIRRIRLPENRSFCGEPSIIELMKEPYLIGLSYDDKGMGYVSLISIFKDDYRELALNQPVSISFHSIFIQ